MDRQRSRVDSAARRRYRTLENHPLAYQSGDQIRTSIEERFQSGSLSGAVWKTIGEVEPSQHGLRLGNDGGTSQRPYLLTSQEFDPSQGAVTVVCDVRFEDFRNDQEASFAILTRSADQQSKPGTPWQDMLARSMRCRIMTDPLSGEGRLQASAKYEADREQTNISWGGFSGPQPNTLYRIEMRDDGLNVSFAVSLAENPSVRKTITCRSLFRGNQNFIALEGSNVGTTIVERLTISQDRAPLGSSKLLSLPAVDDSNELASPDADSAKQLDALVPKAAQLLLKDDFDDGKLDSSKWTTLGDVLWKDGQVQLGMPNDEEHIDTWHSRPYLITKRSFDPAAGPLCIVGKATFSANFLQGYGGSFAVMTRAEDRHGQGPGWENSILRLGVRSNFWPAAYGFDHSLEIHEKPSPNVIAILAAEAFPISANSPSLRIPCRRRWAFRVSYVCGRQEPQHPKNAGSRHFVGGIVQRKNRLRKLLGVSRVIGKCPHLSNGSFRQIEVVSCSSSPKHRSEFKLGCRKVRSVDKRHQLANDKLETRRSKNRPS